jgi:hypothetical protein
MYTVTVTLMFSVLVWNAFASTGMAGKYTLAVSGLCIIQGSGTVSDKL